MALTFYHVRWCPECALIREKLEELKVSYEDVPVPDIRMFRRQVHEVSGQYYVPVITDGDLVLTETRDILAYLDERYGKEGPGPEASGQWLKRTAKSKGSQAQHGEGDEYPSCRL
jgi:glutathione S-transferase